MKRFALCDVGRLRVVGALVSLIAFVSSVTSRGAIAAFASSLPTFPQALQRRLASTKRAFAAYLRDVETDTDRRVAEGEREHLIYYALQSAAFTDPSPHRAGRQRAGGSSSKLSDPERERLVADPSYLPGAGWPAAERARVADLLRALAEGVGRPASDVLQRAAARRASDSAVGSRPSIRTTCVSRDSSTGRSSSRRAPLPATWRGRTAVSEPRAQLGHADRSGLRRLPRPGHDRARSTRRCAFASVVVIGPGLDLAPRTDLIDAVAPQSYQPFAVADALLALSLCLRAGPAHSLGRREPDGSSASCRPSRASRSRCICSPALPKQRSSRSAPITGRT